MGNVPDPLEVTLGSTTWRCTRSDREVTLVIMKTDSGSRQIVRLPVGLEFGSLDADGDRVRIRLRLRPELAGELGLTPMQTGSWSAWPPDDPTWRIPFLDRLLPAEEASLFLFAGGVREGEVAARVAAHAERRARLNAAYLLRRQENNARYRRIAAQCDQVSTRGVRAELDAAIQEAGLSLHAERIRGLTLPSVALIPDPSAPSRSRLGGTPDGFWPRRQEFYFPFVAQIDLADLPRLPGVPLPEAGLLSFFHGDLITADAPGGQVLYHPVVPPHRASLPSGALWTDPNIERPYDESPVRFALQPTIPIYGSHGYDALVDGWSQDETDAHEVLDELLERSPTRLGGHAYSLDRDYCTELAFERFGRRNVRRKSSLGVQDALARHAAGVPGWSSKQAPAEAADHAWLLEHDDEVEMEAWEWICLLQVDSHMELGMCFWDAGVLMYFVRRDDLAARRFDRVVVKLCSS